MSLATSVVVVSLLVVYFLLTEVNAERNLWRVNRLQGVHEGGSDLVKFQETHTLKHYDTKESKECCEEVKKEKPIEGELYYIELLYKQTPLDAFCTLDMEKLDKAVIYDCHIDEEGVNEHVFDLIFDPEGTWELKTTTMYTITTDATSSETSVATKEVQLASREALEMIAGCRLKEVKLMMRRWLPTKSTEDSRTRASMEPAKGTDVA